MADTAFILFTLAFFAALAAAARLATRSDPGRGTDR